MSNGLCPECGCELEETEDEVWVGDYLNILVIEIIYQCPCCDYWETRYDAE